MENTPPKNQLDNNSTLLKLALTGDHAAYRNFLDNISLFLRRFLLTRVPNCDVEDVLQEILISVHKARHTYDGTRAVLPWVFAIARYRLTDYLREHYNNILHGHLDIIDMQDYLADNVTTTTDISEYINKEVKQLPKRQRDILHLLHTEGYTSKEVGVKLGMKESAVKVAAHRAYKLIKSRMKP